MISTRKYDVLLKRNFATGGLCFIMAQSDERKDHYPDIPVQKHIPPSYNNSWS